MDDNYCNSNIISKPDSEYFHGLLEFTDSCIFDFLMGQCSYRPHRTAATEAKVLRGFCPTGNADRHHYETYSKAYRHGKLLHIDNGKRLKLPDCFFYT